MLDQVYPTKNTTCRASYRGIPSEYSKGAPFRIFGMIIAYKIITVIVQFLTLYNARHNVSMHRRHYDITYPVNVQYGAF